MKLFSLPDGSVDSGERAQWLTPIFDLVLIVVPPPPTTLAPEITWGPGRGSPWHAFRQVILEGSGLVIAPPPPPPNYTPAPEITSGPAMPGAPWFSVPILEGQRGSPGTGLFLPGEQRPSGFRPRVSRVIRRQNEDRRLGRHSEEVGAILNSLLDQGYIRLTGYNPLRYQVIAGGLSGEGPPTSDTDASVGAIQGCVYVDETGSKVYFCLEATIANARWSGPF